MYLQRDILGRFTNKYNRNDSAVKCKPLVIIDDKGQKFVSGLKYHCANNTCFPPTFLCNGNEQCVSRLLRLYIKSRTINEGHMIFSALWSIQTKEYIDCEMLHPQF